MKTRLKGKRPAGQVNQDRHPSQRPPPHPTSPQGLDPTLCKGGAIELTYTFCCPNVQQLNKRALLFSPTNGSLLVDTVSSIGDIFNVFVLSLWLRRKLAFGTIKKGHNLILRLIVYLSPITSYFNRIFDPFDEVETVK